MKKNLFQLSLLFSLCTAALCSCAEHDEPITAAPGIPLTIRATAGGFTAADGAETRASESGYTTHFIAGDAIGVFAVKNGEVIADCKNVKCTYDATTQTWTADATAPVYYYTGATYFAYYPYKSDLSTDGITNASGIVTAFGTSLITDQSSYDKYTACDLMTTTQNVSPGTDKTLSFTFAHQMSLIEIALPMQKYKVSNAADAYVYSSPVIDAAFSITKSGTSTPITPCNIGSGVYRYIVPAGTYTVSGEFSAADGKVIGYSQPVSSLSSGNYKRLNVTYSGASTPSVRAIQQYDFYYSDGSICPKDVSNPPREGCIGIVMKVGRDTGSTDNWKDDCTYKQKDGITDMSTIHGYVLALYDANGGGTCTWGFNLTKVEYKVDGVDIMNRDQNTGFYGYKNTQAIISFNNNSSNLSSNSPATYYAAVDYETRENGKYAAPANSSGWFLPSAGQCKYWMNNKTALLASVKKATGNSSYNWKDYYWSSSESTKGYAWYANFRDGNVTNSNKYIDRYVRACLAF